MKTTQADISHLIQALQLCSNDFTQFWDEQQHVESEHEQSPLLLIDGLQNLLELLYRYEQGEGELQESELNELGAYGLTLLENLTYDANNLGYPGHQAFEDLAFPFALWLARRGGEIAELGPVVNALARVANRLSQPEQLESLFQQMNEITESLSVRVTQNLETAQNGNPWPVFLINRGIIAARTLNSEMMEMAFNAIVEYVPESALEFFSEAMEQVELLDYPPHVRRVVERYFNDWNNPSRLH